MSFMKRIWSAVKEPLSDAVIFLGADVAVKKFLSNMTEKAAGKVGDQIFEDQRAALLEDIRIMETEDPSSVVNLNRRHKESMARCRENRFVRLLTKIRSDPQHGRRLMLKYLNDLDDAAFWQRLYFLENDVAVQWMELLEQRVARMRKSLKSAVDSKIDAVIVKMKRAKQRFAAAWRRFAEWIKGLPSFGSFRNRSRANQTDTDPRRPYYDLYCVDPSAEAPVYERVQSPKITKLGFWKWIRWILSGLLLVALLIAIWVIAFATGCFGFFIAGMVFLMRACFQIIPPVDQPVERYLFLAFLCFGGGFLLLWLRKPTKGKILTLALAAGILASIIFLWDFTSKGASSARAVISPSTISQQEKLPTSQEQMAVLLRRIDVLQRQVALLTQNARAGGYVQPGGLTSRTNNPLNIKYSPAVATIGGTDSGIPATDGGTFASFASLEDGVWAGFIMLTDPKFGYTTLTVDAALRRWSNGSYGADGVTSIPGDTMVSQLTRKELSDLISDMIRRESGSGTGAESVQVATRATEPSGMGQHSPSSLQDKFRDGHLQLAVLDCQRQAEFTSQVVCNGDAMNTDSRQEIQVFLPKLKALGENGTEFSVGAGEFGGRSCFEHPFAFPIPQSIPPDGGKVAFSFSLENFDSSKTVTLRIEYFFREGTGTTAYLKIPVT